MPISEPLDFKIFWGGACPQTPLATRAFGARNLPRLLLKSGYGPACTQKTRNGPTSHLGILKGLTVLSKGDSNSPIFFWKPNVLDEQFRPSIFL